MTNKRVYNKPRFTTLRGNTFYINFRLASGAFFRQSLGTDSLKIAEVTMSRLMPFIPLVQSGTMSEEAFKLELKGIRQANKEDIDSFLLHWLKLGTMEAKTIPELGKLNKKHFPDNGPLDPERSRVVAERYAKDNLNQLYNGDEDFAKLMRYSFKLKNLDGSGSDSEIEIASKEITMSRVMLYQAYEAFYSGDLLKYNQLTEAITTQLKTLEAKTIQPHSETNQQSYEQSHNPQERPLKEPKQGDLLLGDAIGLYIKERGSKWVTGIANENDRFFEVLKTILGNVPVQNVTKQDMRHVWEVVKALPVRTKLPYRHMTVEELLACEVPESDLVSSALAGKHWKIYRSFFKVFLVDDKDVLKIAPTDGIKVEIKERRYGNYSRPEMKKLVEHALTLPKNSQMRWCLLLLAYTGARRGEIVRLKASDIRIDPETKRNYFLIASEGGKSEASTRQVPVSLQLVKWGFLDYVKSLKIQKGAKGAVGFIFPRFALSIELFTPEFKTIRNQLGIAEFNDYGDRRVVHSIRHSWISEAMGKAHSPVLIQQIVGHEHSQSLGITSRYTHRMHLKDLLPVIDKLDWI